MQLGSGKIRSQSRPHTRLPRLMQNRLKLTNRRYLLCCGWGWFVRNEPKSTSCDVPSEKLICRRCSPTCSAPVTASVLIVFLWSYEFWLLLKDKKLQPFWAISSAYIVTTLRASFWSFVGSISIPSAYLICTSTNLPSSKNISKMVSYSAWLTWTGRCSLL